MKKDDSVNRALRCALRRRRIRQVDAARACGMDYQSFHRAVSGLRPIYAYELLDLAAAAGVDPLALLREAKEGSDGG